jgi:hypothetical protein
VNPPDLTYPVHRPAPGNPQGKGLNGEPVLLLIRKPPFVERKLLLTGKNEPLYLLMTVIRIYAACMPENRVNAV